MNNDIVSAEGFNKEETFYPYLMYSNNKTIGSMFLTKKQAFTLNEIMKKNNTNLSFVRM